MQFPKKPKRKRRSRTEIAEDDRVEGVLDDARAGPCAACGKTGPSDPDHISTVGSGGKTSFQNIWSLCRSCHTKKGQEGLTTFVHRRQHLMLVLFSKGWEFNVFLKRWIRSIGEEK